jgi:hypothetical protein
MSSSALPYTYTNRRNRERSEPSLLLRPVEMTALHGSNIRSWDVTKWVEKHADLGTRSIETPLGGRQSKLRTRPCA